MKVCLITALTVSDFVDPDMTLRASSREHSPQLGVLTIAASLLRNGFDPRIVNIDELFIRYMAVRKKAGRSTDFFGFVCDNLSSISADVFGLSTICSSYPLTLRIASEIKKRNTSALIVLGGPQASVVDVASLEAYPYLDAIVRGEADHTFPELLRFYEETGSTQFFENVTGVTARIGRSVTRNPENAKVDNLDTLPLPAFHLDEAITKRRGLHLEIGRGCPYACTFCSTNDFFRRKFRLKSTDRMLEDMSYLKKTYGVTSFSLVHDMYTVNRKKVIEFCQSLIESGEGFSWSCSARTDRIDEELIELMSAAGCEGIFFGIETGSRRLQKILKKNLDLEEAKKVIEKSSASGISTAVALITAFPDETIDDFRKTVHFFVDSLRYDGAEPQLSLLAPLAKTVLHTEYKDNLILDKMFSDMSHQGWSHDPRELEMIEGNPELFPNFYAIPTKHVGRPYFKEVHDFTVAIASWFRWVPVALLNDTGDFLNVFDRWKDWAIANGIDQSESYENIPYFFRRQFPKDFLLFVRSEGFKAIARRPDVVITVAEAEVFNFQKGDTPHPAEGHDDSISMGSIPCLEERVHIIELGFDYREILRCLRNGLSFHSIPKKEVTIAFVKSSEQKVVVRELSGLTASLIKHCNGSKTIGEICQVANLSTAKQNKLPAKEKLIPFVMSRLNDQGLVFFRNAA